MKEQNDFSSKGEVIFSTNNPADQHGSNVRDTHEIPPRNAIWSRIQPSLYASSELDTLNTPYIRFGIRGFPFFICTYTVHLSRDIETKNSLHLECKICTLLAVLDYRSNSRKTLKSPLQRISSEQIG